MRRALAAVLLVAATGVARADGAFPSSLALLLPADRPGVIVVATNFGLLVTDDDGATWRWVCEQKIANLPFFYTQGPPPNDDVLAVDLDGIARSPDLCAWSSSTGIEGASDVFADPSDASHVAAVGYARSDGGAGFAQVYESHDGAGSFAPVFAAPDGSIAYGVEIARAAPHTLYATYADASYDPFLVTRGADGSFATRALAPLVGNRVRPFILAVDPDDAATVYLRIYAADHDAFALLSPSGDRVSFALPANQRMTAFVRRADGTILLGAQDALPPNAPAAYRSVDGGKSFAPWSVSLHLIALGERGGVLYAVTDDVRDHFALASSTDEGAHWTPLLRYEDLCGPLACVAAACDWTTQASALAASGIVVTPAAACAGTVDAGAPDLAARVDLAAPVPAPAPAAGCGCRAGARPDAPWAVIFVAASLVAVRRKRLKGRARPWHGGT